MALGGTFVIHRRVGNSAAGHRDPENLHPIKASHGSATMVTATPDEGGVVMKPLLWLVVAAVAVSGCAAPQDENVDRTPTSKVSQTSPPDAAPSAGPATGTDGPRYPVPSPANPRVGQPFTAAILASGEWIKARVTLTVIDLYAGRRFPELAGTPLLFRWTATNIDDHPLSSAKDPVSFRFAALDERDRLTTPSGYVAGSAAPDGCTTLPDKLIWKPHQTVHGCSVQTLRAGARLDRAALLTGDGRTPQAVEFDLG